MKQSQLLSLAAIGGLGALWLLDRNAKQWHRQTRQTVYLPPSFYSTNSYVPHYATPNISAATQEYTPAMQQMNTQTSTPYFHAPAAMPVNLPNDMYASVTTQSSSYTNIPASSGQSRPLNTGISDFIPAVPYLPQRQPAQQPIDYVPVSPINPNFDPGLQPVEVTPINPAFAPIPDNVPVTPQIYLPPSVDPGLLPVYVTPQTYLPPSVDPQLQPVYVSPINPAFAQPANDYQPLQPVEVTPQVYLPPSIDPALQYVYVTPPSTYAGSEYQVPTPQPYLLDYGYITPYSPDTSNQNPFVNSYYGGEGFFSGYTPFGGNWRF